MKTIEQVTITIDKKDLNILCMSVNRFWYKHYKQSLTDKTELGQKYAKHIMDRTKLLEKQLEALK